MLPVAVASKGRPQAPTLQLLADAGLPARVFIEPQDADAYAHWSAHHDLFRLDRNDQGLPYVRQAILEAARGAGLRWYWMLDDDIKRLLRYQGRRAVVVPADEALERAEMEFISQPVAQAGLEYAQFAWSAEGRVRRNSYCDVAVAIRADAPVNFRPETGVKCDRDFTLQLLAQGYDTLRTSAVAFDAPKNGSNRGGLHDAYAAGRERADSEAMVDLWGRGLCALNIKRDGRPDVKINWRRFKHGG
jgi:hypothetical protein